MHGTGEDVDVRMEDDIVRDVEEGISRKRVGTANRPKYSFVEFRNSDHGGSQLMVLVQKHSYCTWAFVVSDDEYCSRHRSMLQYSTVSSRGILRICHYRKTSSPMGIE